MKKMAITVSKKKGGRPTKRPDAKTFAKEYSTHTATELAEKYNVSDSTVRSWGCYYRKAGLIESE